MRAIVALWWAGCGGATGPNGEEPAEICGNGLEDDGNGAVDCADAACACPELCGNGLDDDADGAADCDDADCDGSCPEACTDGRDNDGDGAIDCDDADCSVPECPEVCTDGRDNDGDGASDCSDLDCNDPACDELCTDARDNDGDGAVDCDDPDCDGSCPEDCFDGRDNDLDGLADCDDPACELACPEDCTNGIDDDADALVDCLDPECDEECDADLDGFLNGDHGGDDCDDLDPEVFPGATEVCNDKDDDCNGLVDLDDPGLDPSSLQKFYEDADGDGFGEFGGGVWACVGDPGLVADNTDCDDTEAAVNPGATEICDGLDNDCDGKKDEADPSVDLSTAETWYPDADGDGFGDPLSLGLSACAPPPGHVADNTDCDDTDPLQLGPGDWIPDLDADGWGAGAPIGVIGCTAPYDGLASAWLEEDCDESDPTIHPEAEEICEDGIDQDCNGLDKSCFPLQDPSYSADIVFTDETGSTVMTVAWDGTNLWTSSGGSGGGDRFASYDASGGFLSTYAPGIDFRSVFTIGDGVAPVYSREYAQWKVEEQGAPGSFHSFVTLSGGTLDAQSSVVWDDTRSHFVAHINGLISRWGPGGGHDSDITLIGYGTSGTESLYPQNRGVAVAGGWYFTYDSGTLSAWDETGARVAKTKLNGGGTSFDSNFSLSFAQGRIWVCDNAYGTWRGYPVDL
jgi:hypothetical protein